MRIIMKSRLNKKSICRNCKAHLGNVFVSILLKMKFKI